MCIIAIKKQGVPFPSNKTIENMWYANHDGAGIMYTDGSGRVIIDKGYMKLLDFQKRIEELKKEIDVDKEAVVLHFRIGTSGGNVAGNTHPFPITSNVKDLKSLHIKTNLGIAHNGIISIKPSQKDISDTMEYIKSRLYLIWKAQHYFFKNTEIMGLIDKEIGSKMAFLTPNRMVYTIGNFVTADDGMMYSNYSYATDPYEKFFRSSKYPIIPYSYDYYNYEDDEYIPDSVFFHDGKNSPVHMYDDSYMYADNLYLADDTDYIVDMDTGDMYTIDQFNTGNGFIATDEYGEVYYIDCTGDEEIALPIYEKIALFNSFGSTPKRNPDESVRVVVHGLELISIEDLLPF